MVLGTEWSSYVCTGLLNDRPNGRWRLVNIRFFVLFHLIFLWIACEIHLICSYQNCVNLLLTKIRYAFIWVEILRKMVQFERDHQMNEKQISFLQFRSNKDYQTNGIIIRLPKCILMDWGTKRNYFSKLQKTYPSQKYCVKISNKLCCQVVWTNSFDTIRWSSINDE